MSKKILIVESDEIMQEFLLKIFEEAGKKYKNIFDFDLADSYTEALEKCAELSRSGIKYSLLTMNLRANGMKPAEFLENLHSNQAYRPNRIAIITSDGNGVNNYRIDQKFYDYFLVKPNDVLPPAEKIKGLLSKL